MNELGEKVVKRQEQLAADRSVWEEAWSELADYVLPRRADFQIKRLAGEQRVRAGKVFDSTPVLANEMLAAGLHSLLTNPDSDWFRLEMDDHAINEIDAVREWLEDARRRMTLVFQTPSSGFAPAMHELYMDLGAFGTGCMLIEDGVRFRTFHLAEIFPVENQAGLIDTIYRRFSWTARQIAERFGEAVLPAEIKNAATGMMGGGGHDKRPDKTFEIVHCVAPRPVRDPRRLDNRNMAFMSVYVDVKTKTVLEESGFREFPYVVPRWAKIPGEKFGRSPAWTMLPDIKMLNAMQRTVLKGAQKTVDPPLLIADDGVIQPLSTVPGGLNYGGVDANGRQLVQPLATGARIDIGLEMIERLREHIRFAFMAPLMMTPDSPVKTATEVVIERDERLRLMSPVLGRLQTEFLGPLIERVFAILARRGAFRPAPEILQGRAFSVRYVSPVARAQRSGDLVEFARTMEMVGPMGALDPTVYDNFDFDKGAREISQITGISAKFVRDPQEVEVLRAARQEAQQQQLALQQAMEVAKAAGDAAPAIRELNAAV